MSRFSLPVSRVLRSHIALVLGAVFAFGTLGVSPAAASGAPVDASHPVAGFLRRLEEKGLISPGFWSTLPRSQDEVTAALREAASGRHGPLSPWDRRRLDLYLETFDPARTRTNTILRYADSLATLRGRFTSYNTAVASDSSPGVTGYYFGTLIPGVDGTYGEHLHFSAEAFVGREHSARARFIENYDPQRGLPYGTNRDGKRVPGIPQNVSTFDGFRTVVGYSDGRLALEAGQDWNQWGPGRWQHTTLGTRPHFWSMDSLGPDSLSGYAGNGGTFQEARRGYRSPGEGAPLPQVRFRLRGAQWDYVKLVAERTGLSADSSAWLIAHRLQVRLGAWKFGATEMLAVGGRSPDLITMIPGVPLKIAEHAGGDLDNSALSADVEWTLTGHGRLYAELFVDDYSGPPLNFRGNKFAVVAGGSWQDPFGVTGTLHGEYASVDPWTYGHHRYNTALMHYGALLGSSLPPNSRAVTIAADFPVPLVPGPVVDGSLEWRLRQRDLKSRGGSIFNVFDQGPPGEPNTKSFLERDVETRHQLTAAAAWTWRRYVEAKVGFGGLWVENWRGHAGESLATPTLTTELTVRY